MKHRWMQLALPLLLLLPSATLHAADGARLVNYSQTDVIPIRAKVRFSTLIVLPENEEILDFTTGDKEFWIISGVHNLCYLHPAQAGNVALSYPEHHPDCPCVPCSQMGEHDRR